VQEQVATTLLDSRNMPDLNCIPPAQHDQAWPLLRAIFITVIDEVKNSDASTDVNDSIEDVTDFLVTVSTAAALFLQLQQFPSACFPRRVTSWLRNVHVSRVTTWRS